MLVSLPEHSGHYTEPPDMKDNADSTSDSESADKVNKVTVLIATVQKDILSRKEL